MKRFYTLLASILLISASINAQVYFETVGTGTTTDISSYTGWDNSSPITYSDNEVLYNNDIVDDDPGNYTGASGGSAVQVGGGGSTFTISGINTTGYSNLEMSFGAKANACADSTVLEYSDDGGAWQPLTMTGLQDYSWNMVAVSQIIPESSNLSIRWTNNSDLGWKDLMIDDIKIIDPSQPLPDITITGSIADFGDVIVGIKSTEQSYTIEGSNLNEDIKIIPPEGFEVSLSAGSGYTTDSIVLAESSGTVDPTSVYVRFAPTLEQSYSGNITNYSWGSNSPGIAVSGNGTTPSPFIKLYGSLNDFGNQPVSTASAEQSYIVEGYYLTGDITITPPTGFEISETSGSGFGTSPITLTQTGGEVDSTTIYVRFLPSVEQVYNDTITHVSSGSNDPKLEVKGTGITTDPVIITEQITDFGYQVVNSTSPEKAYQVEAHNLTNDLVITPPTGYEISTGSGASFTATNPINLSPTSGTVSPTNIYVRFTPTAAQVYNDSIAHTSTGASAEYVYVNGTGTDKLLHRCKVVDFGHDHGEGWYNDNSTGTYRSGVNVDVDDDGSSSDDGVAYWKYSFTDPLSPSPIHYDNQETSATFYGGLTAFFDKPNYGFTEGLINENHELRDDHNMMIAHGDNELRHKGYGLWFWKKEDFLNGGHDTLNNVLLDETSLLAVHISRYWAGLEGGRFVVRNNDQFYISEYIFTDALRQTQILRPDTTRWAEYNPSAPYHIIFDTAAANYQYRTFDNVTAAGFYLFKEKLTNENIQLKWHSVEIWATVEREPSAGYYVDMKEVPAGTFSGETFDKFNISRNEISYNTWKKVYEWAVSNQYCFDIPDSRGYVFDRDGDMGSMDYDTLTHSAFEPATDMTWEDAVLWCNALSELEGHTPCYYSDAAKTNILKQIKGRDNPADYDNKYPIYVDYSADGYRLPTPSEWTYAATEGTGTAATGSSDAWSGGQSTTAEVASLDSTDWGLYDVIGNVWEFTWDISNAGDGYDPYGQNEHTVLGGDFIATSAPTSASLPYGENPYTGNFNIGLRVMRIDGGATPPANTVTGSVPVWTYYKDSVLAPADTLDPDSTLVKDDLIYLSGSKTYGEPTDDFYEDDNVGFTRSDGAEITITPFYASKYEISYKKWNEVYQWAVNNGYTFDRDGDMGSMDWSTESFDHGPHEPVADVGWNDAVVWCNALSEYEGLDPVYYADTVGADIVLREANQWRLRMEHRPGYNSASTTQFMTVYPNFSMNGYRLPTEAEWEYLYRNGDETINPGVPTGATSDWLENNSGDHSHDVGTAPANTHGIYDLAGNVEEWIWDWIGHDYYKSHNPKGSGNPDRLFGKGLNGSNFGSEVPAADKSRKERESAARAYLGFRVVRCDSAEHPAVDEFIPEKVLDFDPNDYDPLTGRTFRNNLHRTGSFNKTGIPEGPVSVKWEFTTGSAVKSSPVMVNGVIYIGSNDGRVYAIDADDGSEIWNYSTGANVSASATVVDNVVYIGDESGYFHAIYAQDDTAKGITGGTMKWKVRQTTAKITNTASVVYGTAFTAWQGWANESKITGFDTTDGTEVWRHRQNKGNGGPSGMSVDTFNFYQPVRDNIAAKGELETEIEQWTATGLHAYNFMPIAGDNDVLYAVENYIYNFSRETGSRKWSFYNGSNNDNNQYSSPAVSTIDFGGTDSTVVVYAQLTGDVFGLDLSDGSEIWHYTGAGTFESSPSIADTIFYIGNNDGNLYAINMKDGTEEWKWNAGSPIYSTPLPDDGVVYVGCDDGKVYALHNSSVNTKPTIDPVSDQSHATDNVSEQTISLAGIGDGDAGTQALSVSAESDDNSIVSSVSVNYTSPNTAGTLFYTPQGKEGSALITVTVTDDGSINNSTQITFNVNVTDTNTYSNPTIDAITDQSHPTTVSTEQTIQLTGITDGGEGTQSISVSAVSSQTSYVDGVSVSYTSANNTGELYYTPQGSEGSATITITVADNGPENNTTQTSFNVSIVDTSVNHKPTIDQLTTQTHSTIDQANQSVQLTGISDGDIGSQTLTITTSNSDGSVISNVNVNHTQGESTASLSYMLEGIAGSSTITVTVDDGGATNDTAKMAFTVQVDSFINTAPTINSIADQSLTSTDTAEQTIPIAGISDGDSWLHSVTVTAYSDDDSIAKVTSVDYTSGQTSGTLRYTIGGKEGTATITVIVADGGAGNDTTTVQFSCEVIKTGYIETASGELKVYPNPAHDYFYLEADPLSFNQVYMLDMAGRLLRVVPVENAKTRVSINNINQNALLLLIKGEHKSYITKIIVE